MPSAVSKATVSSQPDYHIVSVRLAACDAFPTTNSDQTTRAAVYSFQSVAERSSSNQNNNNINSSSSSSRHHATSSSSGGGGGGRQAPNPALVTSVGEWVLQRVMETPEWLIRIVRRSLEDDATPQKTATTTSKTKNKSSTNTTTTAATTITSSTPLPEAVLLSSGWGRDLLVLLSEHARPPRNLADIPRVGIAASVLDINDMMERGNKPESDIIAENGTISPGDYLFEHIDYAKKMMKRSKDVFLYLTTEKHHFKRKKSETDADRRPYVYRLFMRGPFSEENAVLEQVTDPEKEWRTSTNGSPGTFDDEEEAEDEESGDDNGDDNRIDMMIHAGENSASSQEDDGSDAGDQDGDDEKEATAAAKRLQKLSQAASPSSNSDEDEEDASSDGNEVEDQGSPRAELRDRKLSAKAPAAQRVDNSVDEEESDDDDSDDDAMADDTKKGNVDEAASVSDDEEEEEAGVKIFGEGNDDDDDDDSGSYAAFTPREIIYLSRIFRGGSIPAKELKWGDMKKANKKDILFARRVVKKLLRKRKRPKQARKPIKKVQESQGLGNEEEPAQTNYESSAKPADPMMVQNDDSRDEANESRASLPRSADVDLPFSEVRELYEMKKDMVKPKSPPKRDVQVAAAGVSGDINLPKVPLIEQAGDAAPLIRNQAEPPEEPASVGNQQAADDDAKKKQGRPKGAKNKKVSETNALDAGTTDARPSSARDKQAHNMESMPQAAKDGVNEELEGSKPSSNEDKPAQDKASASKAAKGGVNEKLEGSKPTHDHEKPDDQPETNAEAGPAETSRGTSRAPNINAITKLDPSDASKDQDKLAAKSKEQQEQVGISKTPPQALAGTSHASSAPDKASNLPPVESVFAPSVPQSLSQTKPAEPQNSTAPVDNPKGEESSKKRGRPKGSKNKKKNEEGDESASKKRKKKDGDKAKDKSTKNEKRESKKKQKTSHAAPNVGVGPKESTDAPRTLAPSVEASQSVAAGESGEATKSKSKEREK